jgi:hypothetical protein
MSVSSKDKKNVKFSQVGGGVFLWQSSLAFIGVAQQSVPIVLG